MKKIVKKVLALIWVAAAICCFTACQNASEPAETPNALVPSVMHDNKLYCTTGKRLPVEVDESAIIGTITSTVPISQWPAEEGQANFEALDAPYAFIEDGLVVLVENEWTLFEHIEISEHADSD